MEIDFRRAERDAVQRRFPGFPENLRGVKQGFGRDATSVEADTAKPRFLLNEDNFLASVRCVKGRGVPSRPSAEHCDFSFNRFHVGLLNESLRGRFSHDALDSHASRKTKVLHPPLWSFPIPERDPP